AGRAGRLRDQSADPLWRRHISAVLSAHPGLARPSQPRPYAMLAHGWWIGLNLLCIAALICVIPRFAGAEFALGWRLDAVAFGIFVLHIARFFADFMLTYGFYYPPWGVP